MKNLLDNTDIREVGAPVSLATGIDGNSDRIDMSGWDGILFITPITDIANTSVAAMTVEQNTADSDSGMTALTGAVATVTSSGDDDVNNQLLIVDVYKPIERYVQAVRTSLTADAAFGNVIAILYRGRKLPATLGASVADSAKVQSPVEV